MTVVEACCLPGPGLAFCLCVFICLPTGQGCRSGEECLPNIHEGLGSISSPARKERENTDLLL